MSYKIKYLHVNELVYIKLQTYIYIYIYIYVYVYIHLLQSNCCELEIKKRNAIDIIIL